MAYYRTCPECGANLDPGEICADCAKKRGNDEKETPQIIIPARIVAMNRSNSRLKAAAGWEYN